MKHVYLEIKDIVIWFAGFFETDAPQSMTRLCTFILIDSGVIYCFFHPMEAMPGLEMILIGLTGKITQKRLTERKSIKK